LPQDKNATLQAMPTTFCEGNEKERRKFGGDVGEQNDRNTSTKDKNILGGGREARKKHYKA